MRAWSDFIDIVTEFDIDQSRLIWTKISLCIGNKNWEETIYYINFVSQTSSC